MTKYPNIEFDENLLTESNKNAILHNLNIASLNLTEFNKRNPEKDDIKFRYIRAIDNSLTFERVKTSPYNLYHYTDEYLPLDWYIDMSRNPQWHEQWIKHLFSERMFNYFVKNHLANGDESIELFNRLFRDFVPLGDFLSKEHSMMFKKYINDRCDLANSYKGKNI